MLTLQEIIQSTNGKLVCGKLTGTVKGVSIDSRKVHRNELFIAIKGDRFDGHDFVVDAQKKGVRFFVVHKPVKVVNAETRVILVKDTTKALGDLAKFHRLRFTIPVIGITGSAGKTTTKEMIVAVLKKKFKVLANEGTQNNHIGVPLTLLKLNHKHQVAVIEMGTNQPGDIAWLALMSAPTMAVLTNIGESHLEKLKNLPGVFNEKMHLARSVLKGGAIIFNADDAFLTAIKKEKLLGRIVGYSVLAKSTYQAKDIRMDFRQGIQFDVNKNKFSLKTFADQMTYNALASIVCGDLLGVSMSHIRDAIRRFRFANGRQEIIKKRGLTIFNDTYNANPVSMRCAVRTLDSYPARGRRIFVCADMLELGKRTKEMHIGIGQYAADSKIDVLMTLGDQAKWISSTAQAYRSKLIVFHFSEIENLQQYLNVMCQKGDVVLVKGSRRMKMESVVLGLMDGARN